MAEQNMVTDIVAPACIDRRLQLFFLSTYLEKFILLIFYKSDFAEASSKQIKAFSNRLADFQKMDCEMVGISTDSHFSHLAYITACSHYGGLDGQCSFPLVSDKTFEISRRYGMLDDKNGCCHSGLVLLDPSGIVKFVMTHDSQIEESKMVDMILDIVSAHRVLESKPENVFVPEGWKLGDDLFIVNS